MKILSHQDILQKNESLKNPFWSTYRGMYSSWHGGVILNPEWMVVPVDDHLVHRGDGVFEAIKVKNGKMWLADAHLQRLMGSASRIGLSHPFSPESIIETCQELLQVVELKEAILRVFLSRGPGAFSTNPYDSVGAQLYIIATEFKSLPESKYEQGVKLGVSEIPPKESWLAQIKTCNYIPNVMMKKEAVDRGLDFVVGVDTEGFVTESSTENIIILDQKNRLRRPTLKGILKGTTMMRALELSQELLASGEIYSIEEGPFTWAEILSAKEVMMVGTTLDVLPVGDVEGHKFEDRRVAQKLRQLLIEDQK